MTINKTGKIEVDMDYEIIFGRYLKSLFDFCFSISDSISLTQPHNIGMTKIECEEAKKEKIIYQKQRGHFIEPDITDDEFLQMYKEMGQTEDEINYYISMHRERVKEYDNNFRKTVEEVRSYIEDNFSKYKLTERKVTCITPCTVGGEKVMYFFEIEDAIKHQFYEMEDLFSHVIKNETAALYLDDPVFYKENDIILTICSHESYATLYLTESQYEDFRSLEIPHLTSAHRWWDREDFPYKYSVNIGLQEAGRISGLFGAIDFYEVYGADGTTELYNQYKGILKPNRITVSEILDKLNAKYKLTEYSSNIIEEQIKRNVYCTSYFSRQINSIKDMNVHIYELECENDKIIVGVELNSGYICVDMSSVAEDINKHYINAFGFIDELNDKETDNNNTREIKNNHDDIDNILIKYDAESKHDLAMFTSYNRDRFSEKFYKILDEVTALRGLDEFELRNKSLVVNYLRAMGIK